MNALTSSLGPAMGPVLEERLQVLYSRRKAVSDLIHSLEQYELATPQRRPWMWAGAAQSSAADSLGLP